nr:lipopolysaccharide biosynthesis protein [Bradyrhizobium sp. 151]
MSKRSPLGANLTFDRGGLAGAATYAYANRVASFVISIGSLAVLARLLNPHEFGLVAMVTTFTGLLGLLRDFGLSSAAIQSANLSPADKSALFWYNVGLSALASILVLLAIPLVSAFYDEQALRPLLYVAAVGLLVSGISSIHAALLRRDFNLRGIFFAEVGGLATGAIVSAFLAVITHSAMAVVIGGLLQGFVTSTITLLWGRWIPVLDGAIKGRLHYLVFGLRVSAFSMLNYITNNVGSVVVGYQSGSAAMGSFNRAQNLYGLPVSLVLAPYLQVQFPLLCRVRGNGNDTRQIYGDLLALTSTIFLPLSALLPFIAAPATLVVLGSQWAEAGHILAWFSPSLAALGLVGPFGQFMTSQGRVKELQWWGLADVGLRGGGALIGSLFGPASAAAGFSLATLFLAVPIMIWLTQRDGIFGIKHYARACSSGVLIAFSVGVTALTLSHLIQTASFGPLAQSVLIISGSIIPWITLGVVLRVRPSQLRALLSRLRT